MNKRFQILLYLMDGLRMKEIAYRLSISTPMVKYHIVKLRRQYKAVTNEQLIVKWLYSYQTNQVGQTGKKNEKATSNNTAPGFAVVQSEQSNPSFRIL